jgi:hypothetical protein
MHLRAQSSIPQASKVSICSSELYFQQFDTVRTAIESRDYTKFLSRNTDITLHWKSSTTVMSSIPRIRYINRPFIDATVVHSGTSIKVNIYPLMIKYNNPSFAIMF